VSPDLLATFAIIPQKRDYQYGRKYKQENLYKMGGMITWQIEKENNSDKKLAIKHAAKQLEMKRFFKLTGN
jgi:ABC-type Mn2+/Zn2+ transport system ATPase subunit